MGKVFCFGEFLLRMSPSMNRQWLHDATLPVYIGGAELNAATALSKWKVPVKYCSALPENFMTKQIIEELESKNIDTSTIHFSGSRIGVYYLQQGADLKKVDVIYDRAHSSFSELRTGMIDWDKVLSDCSWFHFSAISPALSLETAALCREGLEAARSKGLRISVDLNYRAKLWKYGKDPVDVMPELVAYCDVVMGNLWAAESLLGIASPIKDSTGKSKEELVSASKISMQDMQQVFPLAKNIAYTFRLEDQYFAVLRQEEQVYVSSDFALQDIVDRVGSGDCFMAGLIYGLYNRHQPNELLDFSAAAAVGKMHEKGDATNQTIEQILYKLKRK